MGRPGVVASEATLAALYLRGGPPRGPLRRARWCLVRDAVLKSDPALKQVPSALRDAGLWDEAAALEDGRLEWALRLLEDGRTLTAGSDDYPRRWLQTLGTAAPPALWNRGPVPIGDTLSVVGTREPRTSDVRFARSLVRTALSLGLSIVSGGAKGVDRAAESTAAQMCAGRTVVLYPCGLETVPENPDVCQLSVCEPWAGFTAAQAMERNTLIYARSPLTAVIRPRYRTGGTWSGAVDAIRRRSTLAAVVGPQGDEAVESLVRLGAQRMTSVDALNDLYAMALAREREASPVLDGFD